MPGPPPKDPSVRARRNKSHARLRLPASGRSADPPAWPLRANRDLERQHAIAELAVERLRGQLNDITDKRVVKRLEKELDERLADVTAAEEGLEEQRAAESQLWTELWKTPQAIAWEENGWTREVALYVRCTLKAEDGDMRAAGEARQRSDRLGLSPLALLRLGWEIDQAPAPGAASTTSAPRKAAARKSGPPPADPRRALHAVG